MRKDKLTTIAKGDTIIRKVGEFYFLKHSGNELRKRNFSAKHMRMAASVLVTGQELDGTNYDLENYLKPEKFSTVQNAALKLAGAEEEGNYSNLTHLSTAKNIGYEIKKNGLK